MILDIVTYPAASLKEKCVPVTEITDEIRQLAADMLETMYEAPGVGLAAPQVGRNIRMLVMDPAAQDEEKQPARRARASALHGSGRQDRGRGSGRLPGHRHPA